VLAAGSTGPRARPLLEVAGLGASAVVQAARAGATGDLTGVRVGVVSQFTGDGYQPGVLRAFEVAVSRLRELGAQIERVATEPVHA